MHHFSDQVSCSQVLHDTCLRMLRYLEAAEIKEVLVSLVQTRKRLRELLDLRRANLSDLSLAQQLKDEYDHLRHRSVDLSGIQKYLTLDEVSSQRLACRVSENLLSYNILCCRSRRLRCYAGSRIASSSQSELYRFLRIVVLCRPLKYLSGFIRRVLP